MPTKSHLKPFGGKPAVSCKSCLKSIHPILGQVAGFSITSTWPRTVRAKSDPSWASCPRGCLGCNLMVGQEKVRVEHSLTVWKFTVAVVQLISRELDSTPAEVHNFSIAAETPLVNYTHFLIYTASALAEPLGCRFRIWGWDEFSGERVVCGVNVSTLKDTRTCWKVIRLSRLVLDLSSTLSCFLNDALSFWHYMRDMTFLGLTTLVYCFWFCKAVCARPFVRFFVVFKLPWACTCRASYFPQNKGLHPF